MAKKTLSDDVVGTLTQAIMETRRDLTAEYPVLKQISAPNTDKDDDKDTYIPIHPGAAAYFDGSQKTFLDRYGDQLTYGSMILGSLASIFALYGNSTFGGGTATVVEIEKHIIDEHQWITREESHLAFASSTTTS